MGIIFFSLYCDSKMEVVNNRNYTCIEMGEIIETVLYLYICVVFLKNHHIELTYCFKDIFRSLQFVLNKQRAFNTNVI